MAHSQGKPFGRRTRGGARPHGMGSACSELSTWLSARYRAQEAAARGTAATQSTCQDADAVSAPQLVRTCSAPTEWSGDGDGECATRPPSLASSHASRAPFLAALRKAVAAHARGSLPRAGQ